MTCWAVGGSVNLGQETTIFFWCGGPNPVEMTRISIWRDQLKQKGKHK